MNFAEFDNLSKGEKAAVFGASALNSAGGWASANRHWWKSPGAEWAGGVRPDFNWRPLHHIQFGRPGDGSSTDQTTDDNTYEDDSHARLVEASAAPWQQQQQQPRESEPGPTVWPMGPARQPRPTARSAWAQMERRRPVGAIEATARDVVEGI